MKCSVAELGVHYVVLTIRPYTLKRAPLRQKRARNRGKSVYARYLHCNTLTNGPYRVRRRIHTAQLPMQRTVVTPEFLSRKPQ